MSRGGSGSHEKIDRYERRAGKLQRLRERRERLIRGFGHDVKNPLGAADGYLALLEEGLVDASSPEGEDAIQRARRSIRSALGLIEDLVSFSEVESTKLELHLRPLDIREIVLEVTDDYRGRGEEKGLTLRATFPQLIRKVYSDPARVRQILGNLVSNAVKYTDSGGVEVVVEEARIEDDRDGRAPTAVATHVRDSGPGIPAEKVELLFHEFSRLGSEKEGTGLGLAISLRIARELGGDITVCSEPGSGSTFTLWLPGEGTASLAAGDGGAEPGLPSEHGEGALVPAE